MLTDRGIARASFLAWLQARRLDYVVRINSGTCVTETDGRRWKLGQEALRPGEVGWRPAVRHGLYHDRPRDLLINLARCWRAPRHEQRNPRRKPPTAPWYLATSLVGASLAAAWY